MAPGRSCDFFVLYPQCLGRPLANLCARREAPAPIQNTCRPGEGVRAQAPSFVDGYYQSNYLTVPHRRGNPWFTRSVDIFSARAAIFSIMLVKSVDIGSCRA